MTRMRLFGLSIVAVALGAMLGAGAHVLAQGSGGFGGHAMGRGFGGPGMQMFGRLGKELGITDAQRQQIKTIMQQHREEIGPLAKTALDAREALMDAARNNADDGTLQQKATDLGTAESQLALARAKVQGQIFTQVLTADQQKKALALRDQMKARMQQHMQRKGAASGLK